MTVTTRRVVIRDDRIGTKQANLKDHTSQNFLLAPRTKRLFSRFRKTKIAEAEKVWFGTLHGGSGYRFACANHPEIFVEFRADRVLTAFADYKKIWPIGSPTAAK